MGQLNLFGRVICRVVWSGTLIVKSSLAIGILLCGYSHAVAQNAVYERNVRPIAIRVKIVARSTSVHQIFAGNEDVYLAQTLAKRGAEIVKLVDMYSAGEVPIRSELLVNLQPFRMRMTRDFQCDVKAGAFFLGKESLIFDPAVPELLSNHAAESIACYRVDHTRTRLTK